MDRIKLNTKAMLGMATRTVDQEHQVRHNCTKVMATAVQQYEAAMAKAVTAVKELGTAFEAVSRAFREVGLNEKQEPIADAVRDTTGAIDGMHDMTFGVCHDRLKSTVSVVLSVLKSDCDICERLHVERSKAVDAYDYHRDLVEKKEVQYASKGKSLEDSKTYKEAINRRDAAKADYVSRHDEYNSAYMKLMEKKGELTIESLHSFLECITVFATSICSTLEKPLKAVKVVSENPPKRELRSLTHVEEEGGDTSDKETNRESAWSIHAGEGRRAPASQAEEASQPDHTSTNDEDGVACTEQLSSATTTNDENADGSSAAEDEPEAPQNDGKEARTSEMQATK